MSKQVIIIDSGSLTAAGFKSVCDLAPGQLVACNNLSSFFASVAGGNQMATIKVNVGAVSASCAITFSNAPTAAQACYIGNVTITAVASGAAGFQFNVGSNGPTAAANLATTINRQFPNAISATVVGSTVTLTAVVPGVSGNSLGVSIGNLSNATLGSSFLNGVDGTSYTLKLA